MKKTTENKKFSCKNCGAFLTFEPGADGLRCSHCGALNEIETANDFEIIEEDFEAMLAELCKNSENRITVHQTKCGSCSAISTLPKNVTSASCPFCGSNVVIDNASSATILKPKYLIPFKTSQEQAEEGFYEWVKDIYWAPNSIKTQSSIEKLTSVYIPYWTFDSQTETAYKGERGIEYNTEDGKSTKWTTVYNDISHFFDDVLVVASNSLSRTLSEDLTRWNYEDMVPFAEEFLSGVRTEIYQVSLEEGFEHAKKIMKEELKYIIKKDIGGDDQRIKLSKSQFNDVTFKHILLPIWISSYRYRNKRYNIIINGQNGDVSGTYPKSFWKVFIPTLIFVLFVALMLYVFIWEDIKHYFF